MAGENTATTEKVEKPKIVRDRRNGQTRPLGDKTAKIWDIADQLHTSLGRVPTKEEVWAEYVKVEPSAREATTATQYGRWVIWSGLTEQAKAHRKALRAAQAGDKEIEKEAKRVAREKAKADKEEAAKEKKAQREKAAADKKVAADARRAERQAAKEAKDKEKAAAEAAKQAPAQPAPAAAPEAETEASPSDEYNVEE